MSNNQRGATMIEFSLILLGMLTVLFGTIEIGRLVMNYTTLADAARAATRYAIVHGVDRTGSGADGPSGPPPNYSGSQIVTVINSYINAASMNPANLSTPVITYNPDNSVGSSVTVQLSYSYQPMLLTFFPVNLLSMTLSTTSEGIICY